MSVSIEQGGQIRSKRRTTLDNIARKMVFKMLNHLKVGHLIFEEQGQTHCFGQDRQSADLVAHVSVKCPSTYRQMVFNGTIGAGESYMRGHWETRDLLSVIRIFSKNQAALNAMQNRWTRLGSSALKLFHKMNTNSQAGSKRNISAHYDLSNDFFKLMLDPSMMYSSAIYPHAQASLHEASLNKLDHICQRLALKPEDHLLEIGTGWGSLAIHAAKHYGCRVTSTTISQEQYAYAKAAVAKAGLEDRVEILFKDYRDLEGQYDRLVSVEMIEAVGHKFYPVFFQTCNKLLKSDGLMLIQSITIADQRYKDYLGSVDFIQRYIFPGGSLPCVQVFGEQLASNTDMQLVGLEDITLHYADTLADWRKNFFAEIEKIHALGFDSVFERMWEYYLCYCEGGFRERMISTVQILAAKPELQELPSIAVKSDLMSA